MATHLHLHRLRPPPPSPRLLRPISIPAPPPPPPRLRRPPLASIRPPAPPPPLLLSSSDPVQANGDAPAAAEETGAREDEGYVESVGAGEHSAGVPAHLGAARVGLGDPVFFLLAFVAVATSAAFTGMVAVAIPTMLAMKRAADSFTLLADAALEELPSTMAAVRLSGMEISDLTLELSDLSQEIADGVNKSAKVAQAVEAGLGQMRDLARQQATSMIEERANLQTIPNAPKKNAAKLNGSARQEKGPFTRQS